MTVGLLLTLYGVYTAVVDQSTYWYSYFTVGSFLFFDSLDFQLNGDSNLFRLIKGQPKTVVGTYLFFLVFGGVLIDVVFGRGIGALWTYPNLSGFSEIIHVLLIGYPFALLSVSSMYRTFHALLTRVLRESGDYKTSTRTGWRMRLAKALSIMFVVSLILPIANWLVFDNRYANELLIICSLLGVFSISPFTYLLFQDSWFEQLFRFEKSTLMALFLTFLVASFAHELPNTFAWEWLYQNIPFTSLEIFKINIIILIPAWLFLTILAVAGNDFFFQWANSK